MTSAPRGFPQNFGKNYLIFEVGWIPSEKTEKNNRNIVWPVGKNKKSLHQDGRRALPQTAGL